MPDLQFLSKMATVYYGIHEILFDLYTCINWPTWGNYHVTFCIVKGLQNHPKLMPEWLNILLYISFEILASKVFIDIRYSTVFKMTLVWECLT